MWSKDKIMEYLKENLKESRYRHSLSVSETAVKLAKIYNEDQEKAKLAGLVHDCAKNMSDEELISLGEKEYGKLDEVMLSSPQLLHGQVGAIIARDKMDICDEDVLNSIKYHTTGRTSMSLLEKIIYIADYVEPYRDFKGVEELRNWAYVDIDKALVMALDNTIKYVLSRKQLLHIDTIKSRNNMIIKNQ